VRLSEMGHKMKKEKPKCKNCGDETTFRSNCDFEREKEGWCVSCFQFRKGNLRTRHSGEEFWKERTIADSTPYDSRPPKGYDE